MSKFEDLQKPQAAQPAPGPATSAPSVSPMSPKGAPIDVSERLSGRRPDREAAAVEAAGQAQPMPLTREDREALRARLLKAATGFAIMAPIPNADIIPFLPDVEPRNVAARIAQGPRVYRSMQEKAMKEDGPEPVTARIGHEKPTLAHPDMSKPGRFIKGESPPYRPL